MNQLKTKLIDKDPLKQFQWNWNKKVKTRSLLENYIIDRKLTFVEIDIQTNSNLMKLILQLVTKEVLTVYNFAVAFPLRP